MDLRNLADYMAGSRRNERTVLRGCRYRRLARLYNHQEAKAALSKHVVAECGGDMSGLKTKAAALRQRLPDGAYEQALNDINADYIERFAETFNPDELPIAEVRPPHAWPSVNLNGVELRIETQASFQRSMQRSNRVRIGALMLRYAKNSPLPPEVGEWQSALLFGYLTKHGSDDPKSPERPLCATLDVWTGKVHLAPSDALDRFNDAAAACATIAEAWDNLKPPTGAVL